MKILFVASLLVLLSACGMPAAQCAVEIYQCSPTEVKSCPVGSPAPAGCEFVGTGSIDCNLVDDC